LSEEIFLLPDVGEGLVEAEIVTWKVNVGDVVTLNQPLVDIETAKATVELPSPYAGTVVALHGNVGDVMEVHKPLITFEVGGNGGRAGSERSRECAERSDGHEGTRTEEASIGEGREAVLVGYGVANEDGVATRKHRRAGRNGAVSAPPAPTPSTPTPVAPTVTTSALAPRSTPPVRLYAKQHGVDIATLAGTGRDGLITRNDVEQALSGSPVAAPTRGPAPITGPTRRLASWARISSRGRRARKKSAFPSRASCVRWPTPWCKAHSAHRTLRYGCAWTPRAPWSSRLAEEAAEPSGVRLSPLTIIALAMCDAARHFPGINSSFDAAANEVVVRRSVNLGIAANTPRGSDRAQHQGRRSARPGGHGVRRSTVLVDKARSGTTTPNEMIGTTLTITNVGPFGVDAAIPILPPGTGRHSRVGQIAKAPWVVNDEVVVRQVCEIAMAFDHRQVDGAMASAVLAHIGRFLARPRRGNDRRLSLRSRSASSDLSAWVFMLNSLLMTSAMRGPDR
jgi:2-oxoisovalerate dehydrogenase E2 component (dihydrolipoyl transacylase)